MPKNPPREPLLQVVEDEQQQQQQQQQLEPARADATPEPVAAPPSAAIVRTADLMLGLKALVDHVEVSPASPQLPRSARPASTWTPVRIAPRTQSPHASHRPALVLPPIASMDARTRQPSVPSIDHNRATEPECSQRLFLGRKNKRDEDRMNPVASSSSPTAVWEGEATSQCPSSQAHGEK
ncbi:hypothetical protein P43SY_000173 [Pythium insidiosum]|uniref:Uncharacterized protein n=1 Tax=Pythium insidiosum TaxID=114742 RepID=A0AAD5LGU8_PYTIN|nr:hypothetical protein P43SY_000173 [Pythium insidiosum]